MSLDDADKVATIVGLGIAVIGLVVMITQVQKPRLRFVLAAALVLVLLVGGLLLWAAKSAPPQANLPAGSSPSSMVGSDCLFGEWTSTVWVSGVSDIGGAKVQLAGPSGTLSYGLNGKTIYTYGTEGVVHSGSSDGHRYERTFTGWIMSDYKVEGEEIVTTNSDGSNGRWVDKVDGTKVGEGVTRSVNGRESFVCKADTLTTWGKDTRGQTFSQTWKRMPR